ncbi:MAG TPA: N-acetylmuramoyl-L-alanine amidase [Anaeromyxobacteraceae bacterium]|nr:N-acetylmuramoyl-L-alanine amidase [Anaeromyxobacteraceae bacterium]
MPLLLALLLALLPGAAFAAPPPLLVVVDPGHGGDKDGAVSPLGLKEKDLTLAIARKLAERLRAGGAEVVLTREADAPVDLARRAGLANARQADLFVSVHLNSMPGRARGTTHGVETYFLSADASDAGAHAVAARENADKLAGGAPFDPNDPVGGILQDLQDADALAESSRLAYAIHERVVARTGAPDRGVKQAPFYVLAGARMPAVLLELGFVSQPAEARRLADPAYQDRLARAVADGIASWRRPGAAAIMRAP